MTKTFLVMGSNWTAEVELSNIEDLPKELFPLEAATRAVEACYGKRTDVEVFLHDPIKLSNKQKASCELHTALVELLTDELQKGCGIGNLLCIMDKDPNGDEFYISSKTVLENAGIPKLVAAFDEKYPDKKKQTT